MKKINSLSKKISSISKEGLDPIIEGMTEGIRNYDKNIPDIENRARKRLESCSDCLIDEPIKSFRIEDKRIPELSNKMCDDCGCAAPYFFRQDIKKCKNWKD